MPTCWGRWAQEYRADATQAFRGNGKLTPEQEGLRRLRAENRQLKLEREILKKRRPSSRKSRTEILVHCPGEEGLPGEAALPVAGRKSWRIL